MLTAVATLGIVGTSSASADLCPLARAEWTTGTRSALRAKINNNKSACSDELPIRSVY